MTSPVDICNVALAEAQTRTSINGFPPIDNSPAAVASKLFFTTKTQMVLRGANWDFARRQENLTLLRAAVINGAVSSDPPPQPWQYEYLYPADCLKLRFLIQYQQPQPSGTPLTTAPTNAIAPALATTNVPFVIAAKVNATTGSPTKTILTNMANAQGVYTADLSQYPDMWDAMFTAADTATLGAYLVATLSGDKAMMQLQIAVAKGALDAARAANGNEGMPQQDVIPDWIRIRNAGAFWGVNWGAAGQPYYGGWEACAMPDGLFY